MTHYTISNCLLCYVIVVSKIKHTIYTAVVIMKCKKKKKPNYKMFVDAFMCDM